MVPLWRRKTCAFFNKRVKEQFFCLRRQALPSPVKEQHRSLPSLRLTPSAAASINAIAARRLKTTAETVAGGHVAAFYYHVISVWPN